MNFPRSPSHRRREIEGNKKQRNFYHKEHEGHEEKLIILRALRVLRGGKM